jgi:hypothetical protein
VIALLSFFVRDGATHRGFYGLEYEDAYVYAAAARQQYVLGNANPHFLQGLTVCAVGSLEDCSESETFPEHLQGSPALLRGFLALWGYRVWLAPMVGAVVSGVTTAVVWWSARLIYESSPAAALAALFFAVTPVLALYGGSATSESVASLPIAVAIAASAAVRRSRTISSWYFWYTIATVAVVLATAVRRELLILFAALPACFVWSPTPNVKHRRLAVVVWFGVAALAAVWVFRSSAGELSEYGQAAFDLGRALKSLPSILHAAVTPQWFGVLAVASSVGVVLESVKPSSDGRDRSLLITLGAVAAVMVFLYAAHVRSMYQVMGAQVDAFDFLRYLANTGVPMCLLSPAGLSPAWLHSTGRPSVSRVCFVFATLYFALMVHTSWALRHELGETERIERSEPAIAAVDVASSFENRYPIVTFEPLVVQLYGKPSTKVIALGFLNRDQVRRAGGRILYVRQDHYEDEISRRRYADFLSGLPDDGVIELRKGPGWSVLAMGEPLRETP